MAFLFHGSITCMNTIVQLIFFACYIHFSLQQTFSSSPETLPNLSLYLLDHERSVYTEDAPGVAAFVVA